MFQSDASPNFAQFPQLRIASRRPKSNDTILLFKRRLI